GRELLKVRLTARGAALSAGLFAGALAPTARATVPEPLRQSTTAIAVRAATIPPMIAQLANEGIRMSSLTRWGIAAAILTAACGVRRSIALAATPQPPPKGAPAPAKPPAPEVKCDRFNDPLPKHAVARMGTIAFRHRGAIFRLTYTPDGKMLIAAG